MVRSKECYFWGGGDGDITSIIGIGVCLVGTIVR